MRWIGRGLHVATALLVTFKLVGALSWPWLWVVAPSLCAFGMGAVFLLVAGVALLIHKHLMKTDANYRLRNALDNFQRAYARRR